MRKLTEYSFPQEMRVSAKLYDLWTPDEVVTSKLSKSDDKAIRGWMKGILTEFFHRLINESKLLVERGDGFRFDHVADDWKKHLDLLPTTSPELVEFKNALKDQFEKEDLSVEFVVIKAITIHQFAEDFNPDTLALESQRLRVTVGIGA